MLPGIAALNQAAAVEYQPLGVIGVVGPSNADQTCVGIERVYVADLVYETFLAKLANRVSRLRPGSDDGAAGAAGPERRGVPPGAGWRPGPSCRRAWIGRGPGWVPGTGRGGSRPAAADRERSPGGVR